jgi:phosphoglycolate phosphatase
VPARPVAPITHVLFDLDGTIADSQRGILNCLRHAFAAVGLTVPPDADLLPLIGPPLGVALRRFDLDTATIDLLITRYRDRYRPIGIFEADLYEGMAELLADAVKAGLTLAVATSKPEPFAMQLLDHFGLSRHFAVIAGATFDDTRSHKAQIIEHALGLLPGATTEHTVMVGDREYDVLGGAVHGLRTVGVAWGFGTHHELESAGAWHIVDDVAALRVLLAVDGTRARVTTSPAMTRAAR